MKYRIPISKPWITTDDRLAVNAVLERPELGKEVAAFEAELAEYLGRKYVVCVSSGTVALELAHRAHNRFNTLQAVFAFGFIATANAAEVTAPRGIAFIDGNGCLLGETPPQPSYLEVAEQHNATSIRVDFIRDAAQAFGAKLPPSLADCYSFNWNKPITCLGGGCVATDDQSLASEVGRLRNQGRNSVGLTVMAGTNARMSDMQAALGRSQLVRIDEILDERKTIEKCYQRHLPDMIATINQPWTERDSWFLMPIELSNRDEVHAKMHELGIATRSCADWLLPAHPYYANKYGYKRGMFPEAEKRADRTLLLPLYPEMTLEDVQTVCKALEECDARS